MAKASIEKYLERTFCEWCKAHDIVAVKGPAFMYAGIPDRIVPLPDGKGTIWVEFKGDTYYQLTSIQKHWREMLINSDPERYFCINTKDELQSLIDYCER